MLCNIDYIYNIKESFRTLLQGLLLARVYQLITPFVVSHNKHNSWCRLITRYPDIFDSEMRLADKCHTKLVEGMRSVWKNFLAFPPLFEEIMSAEFGRRIIPRMSVCSLGTKLRTQFVVGADGVISFQQAWY